MKNMSLTKLWKSSASRRNQLQAGCEHEYMISESTARTAVMFRARRTADLSRCRLTQQGHALGDRNYCARTVGSMIISVTRRCASGSLTDIYRCMHEVPP